MNKSDVTVDTFGLLCPIPIIKSADAIKNMNTGQILELKATDPGVFKDMKDWCKANRHTYLSDKTEGRILTVWIQKGEK